VAAPLPRHLDIRFAGSDGGAVAYATIGGGPEAVVVIPGFITHTEIAWEHPGLRGVLGALAQRHTVVMFDRRGVGLSDRLAGIGTVESTACDVLAILDAAGIERAWLFGSSEGGPAAIRLASTSPARVRGLALFGAMAKGCRADDYPWALPAEAFDRWRQALVARWGSRPTSRPSRRRGTTTRPPAPGGRACCGTRRHLPA
jgi:pimeloyl-ACP methyl ester carboxylesterase